MRPVALLLALVLSLGACGAQHRPDGSSDGRRHTCGLVTAEGVTEHLGAYRARCG